ncbi:tyrosine-type recombinase/integrase [Pseudahrensia aquimaris]|uniref:Tyrosine-type recombinase/integrase n=1 Tax=Pseudahrensia aquimaris TaxID=744461 RepID=A0ABW3FL23_9HYPH
MPVKKLKNHDYIYERISNDGRLTGYQVKIRHRRFPNFTKSFDRLEDAKEAVYQAQLDRTRGFKGDRTSADKVTVADILNIEIGRLEGGKKPRVDPGPDIARLKRFVREEFIVDYSLSNLRREHWEDYIAERLEDVAPATVKRELAAIRPVMRLACEEHHMLDVLANVPSPHVEDTEIPRIPQRIVKALKKEFKNQQNPWVEACATFALDTGARRGEMLRLEWKDYDPQKGTVWLQRGKNGKGRYILLTKKAAKVIERLPNSNIRRGVIFDTTAETLKQAIERARVIVGAPWVRWHDYRHEAISRLFEAGWTVEQVMDFSGHRDIKSLLRYRHIRIKDKVARLREFERKRKSKRG